MYMLSWFDLVTDLVSLTPSTFFSDEVYYVASVFWVIVLHMMKIPQIKFNSF